MNAAEVLRNYMSGGLQNNINGLRTQMNNRFTNVETSINTLLANVETNINTLRADVLEEVDGVNVSIERVGQATNQIITSLLNTRDLRLVEIPPRRRVETETVEATTAVIMGAEATMTVEVTMAVIMEALAEVTMAVSIEAVLMSVEAVLFLIRQYKICKTTSVCNHYFSIFSQQ
jgi:hypothetical protein